MATFNIARTHGIAVRREFNTNLKVRCYGLGFYKEGDEMAITPLEMTPVQMSARSHLGETQTVEEPAQSFGEMLEDALKKTNELQLESDELNMALAAGRVEDISQVVVAAQKAEIAIQLTLQLRNRAVSAYQEIMRMQV